MQIKTSNCTFSLYNFSCGFIEVEFSVVEQSQNIIDISEVISNPYFKEYLSLGLIDEVALRNFIIKNEYKALRLNNSAYESIYILSQKFNLSDSAINTILFRKRVKKKVSIDFNKVLPSLKPVNE